MIRQVLRFSILGALGTLAACGSDAGTPPAPSAAAPAPTTASASPSPSEVVDAGPPEPPSPADLAGAALEHHDFSAVCGFLVSEGFAQNVCDWIAATAAGEHPSLSSRQLETFMRAQHVRRVSGTIVGDIGPNEYETRISGRLAILTTTETTFTTTGHFSMWAQQNGTSEEDLASGRTVDVPIYREWLLFDSITGIARGSRDDAAERAQDVLEELLAMWTIDYCRTDDETGDCWVDPASVDAGVAAEGVDAGLPPVSAARRRECRELICFNYVECHRAGLPAYECAPDLTPECRRCRAEGAVR